MNVFVVIALAMTLVIVMLRRKIPLGPSILAGGLLIWLCTRPTEPILIWNAFTKMASAPRTYDLVGALYFVVCLEIELRKSGCLKGMVDYLLHVIPSKKVALAVMPAFLGLLPSIGGARFSAPIVESISRGENIDNDRLGAINFWFRHIFEFASPIIPGMILACAITGVGIGDLLVHLSWASAVAFICGWLVLLTPIKLNPRGAADPAADFSRERVDFLLAIGSVIVLFIMMVGFHLSAAVSMGAVVLIMVPVLMATNRAVSLKDVFIGAIEKKLFRDVFCILLFIQVLDETGVLAQIVASFDGAPLPTPVIIAIISFIVGVLTGMSQGHVAIVMPIVAALSPGSLDLAGVALVFGVAGQMVTPTHVCMIVTLDYFKSDFFKLVKVSAFIELLVLAVFSAVSFLTWG
ncbi:MAG: DUF401 family protein [Duodenibacillus sp.]|nr:DUF401 family protein [Duodenibacillus sp.]